MSLLLLIKSWRVRAALLWLAHTPSVSILPFAGLGLRVALGWGTPAWGPPAAAWTTAALIVATLVGYRLHKELDDPGVPCRWCDIELTEDNA
ncbi:hypothetical protein [Streptomyces naphthomycinicus]|uniref:hypothetical protein n=1 Tax=Streptomyces naphthomycinicus TaxID=2872625 RepID=UPI001CEDE91B|nr:hypothetical protein [Streptomyces sp. TML10]